MLDIFLRALDPTPQNIVLRDPTQADGGAAAVTGSGAISLSIMALAGQSKEVFKALSAEAAPIAALAGSAKEIFKAAEAAAIPVGILSGAGKESFRAIGAETAPVKSLAGSGKESFRVAAAETLPAMALAGSSKEIFSAAEAENLPTVSVAGQGGQRFIALASETETAFGSGSSVLIFSGAGAASAPVASIAGDGAAGEGTIDRVGAGLITIPAVTLSAYGEVVAADVEVPALPPQLAIVSGQAFGGRRRIRPVAGNGSAGVAMSVSGRGTMRISGAGSIGIDASVEGRGRKDSSRRELDELLMVA